MITISIFSSAAAAVFAPISFLLYLQHCVRRPGKQEAT